jgi:hypothetical protein
METSVGLTITHIQPGSGMEPEAVSHCWAFVVFQPRREADYRSSGANHVPIHYGSL